MIAVECYADTKLVQTLGVRSRDICHARGKDKVLATLRTTQVGLAIVDEDPRSAQCPEMRHYQTIEQVGGLRLLVHETDQGKRVVVICPRLEEWQLQRAKAAKVDPVDFGLPNDARRLHGSGRYDQRPKYRQFLEKLLASDPEFQCLKKWVGQRP